MVFTEYGHTCSKDTVTRGLRSVHMQLRVWQYTTALHLDFGSINLVAEVNAQGSALLHYSGVRVTLECLSSKKPRLLLHSPRAVPNKFYQALNKLIWYNQPLFLSGALAGRPALEIQILPRVERKH